MYLIHKIRNDSFFCFMNKRNINRICGLNIFKRILYLRKRHIYQMCCFVQSFMQNETLYLFFNAMGKLLSVAIKIYLHCKNDKFIL